MVWVHLYRGLPEKKIWNHWKLKSLWSFKELSSFVMSLLLYLTSQTCWKSLLQIISEAVNGGEWKKSGKWRTFLLILSSFLMGALRLACESLSHCRVPQHTRTVLLCKGRARLKDNSWLLLRVLSQAAPLSQDLSWIQLKVFLQSA